MGIFQHDMGVSSMAASGKPDRTKPTGTKPKSK